MGATNSKVEEDKALQLCRERRKFVKKALDGRCSLAVAHVAYIQSLKSTGGALKKFVEPEAPPDSSMYTPTTATPEPLHLAEKTPSPPSSSRLHTNHMKFSSSSSKKVEEKPPIPDVGTVTSSSTPQNTTPRSNGRSEDSPFGGSSFPSGAPPWDFFGLFHPIDNHISFQDDKDISQGYENSDHMRQMREEEGIPELEDDEEKASFRGKEESHNSEDEFDEPATVSLVRSFENHNRVQDPGEAMALVAEPSPGGLASQSTVLRRHKSTPVISSVRSGISETELLNGDKKKSPDLSPLRGTESVMAVPAETNKAQEKEDNIESKVPPKDFYSSIKDVESQFLKASDSGEEVLRMLEANKLHFRPIVSDKQGGSMASTFLKAFFSCGDDPSQVQEGDPSQVQEKPAQTEVKLLTGPWTTSSRSSSSTKLLGSNSKEDIEDFTGNTFENNCMVSGSHASTLDRLYAWERKIYDEVKASEIIRGDYDAKRKILRHLESIGESSQKIDKTRAGVKDLHSRLRVSIHRIDSISKRIEELRDKELQPQLEELIEGLSRMWKDMSDCHKCQFHIISIAFNIGNARISMQSESRRQITVHLEHELRALSSSFTKWIGAQRSYFQAINDWLIKCAPPDKDKSSKRRRRIPGPPLRDFGPPIYIICGVWLEKIDGIVVKEVAESIKGLAAETARFLPHQEKNSDSAANGSRYEASEDFILGFDHFQSSLVSFIGQLNNFAESSVKMYADLNNAIKNAKNKYERTRPPLQSSSQSQSQSQTQTQTD